VLELLSQVIVPRSAFADPVCSPGDGLGSMPPQKLAAQTSRVLTNLLAGPRTFEQLKSCLVGGLRGAWASTGGTIESLIELIKQGGSSYLEMLSESYAPIDSPQALLGNAVKFSSNLTTGGVDPAVLWKKLLSRVDQIKSFIHQIGPVLSRAFPAFLELSDEAQMEILCNIKAQLSIDTLITILTAGAGSGAVLTKIAAYGGKLAKIADFLVMVGKLGKQFSKASQELMGSVLKGLFKWSEQHLSAINFYSKIGAEKLVVGLSKCD
jgi:hypothetical protein